jgi:mono/diheme cytochrome c family protein
MRHASSVVGALALTAAAALTAAQARQGTSQGGGRMPATGERAALPLDRWQPKRLPALPSGITLDLIRAGDSVFHGKGGCNTCHGPDAFGMPNSGSGLTMGLHFIPSEWKAIDSLVTAGIPEALTRSSVAMPPRGAASNLTPDEVRQVAAYVWAISQVADEPWPGGHRTHESARQ